MIKCKHCGIEKLESAMSIWAGKVSKVCIECKASHPVGGGRSKGNGGGATRRKKDGPL